MESAGSALKDVVKEDAPFGADFVD
jgi:hypothetical protein